jgi:uncharacterized membrane protein HdeD (DUF308 family)
MSPGMTTLVLVQLLGIYWLVDGIFSIVRIFSKSRDTHWGWLLARGIFGIIVGLVVIQHPIWSTVLIPTTIVFVMGFYGLVGGVVGLIEGFSGGVKWGVVALGALSLILGLILLFNPLLGASILPVVVGILTIIFGIIAIILAFKMR